jgi:hypothetical protein
MKFLDIINEEVKIERPEQLTNKEIQKAKLIYKTFKKGYFKYDEVSSYGYELPDDYIIYKYLGNVCIKLTGEEGQDIRTFSKIKVAHLDIDRVTDIEPQNKPLFNWVIEKLQEKFDKFNITINLFFK